MARPLRIEYPGAWYHVMNRGAGRRGIFPDDVMRQAFVSLLRDIIDAISAHTSTTRRDLITATAHRARTVRAMTMLLCRQYGGFGLKSIADAFGIERYSIVASAISRCRDRAAEDAELARELTALK